MLPIPMGIIDWSKYANPSSFTTTHSAKQFGTRSSIVVGNWNSSNGEIGLSGTSVIDPYAIMSASIVILLVKCWYFWLISTAADIKYLSGRRSDIVWISVVDGSK